jgi:hypothetical protein
MSQNDWKLNGVILALLIFGICLGGAHRPAYADSTFPIPAIPIPPKPDPSSVKQFDGRAAVPKHVGAMPVPANPYMGPQNKPQSWSALHNDAYMSDTYFTSGPLGKSPVVKSAWLGLSKDSPYGLVTGLTFDRDRRLVVGAVTVDKAAGQAWVRLRIMDPTNLSTLGIFDLPKQTSTGNNFRPAGTYFYQDEHDRVVIGTGERTVWVISHQCKGQVCTFTHDAKDTYDLTSAIPEDDEIEALQPDWAGRLWFSSKGGVVGTVDMHTGKVLGKLDLAPERIVNGTAADETGGVYIVTSAAMYRFDADKQGAPAITWRETYDAGKEQKPGQVDIGSGTTPTLMGKEFVAITDNADQMHVDVWRRAKEVQGSRLVCSVEVFKGLPTSNENSLVGTNRSVVVENNYGYSDPSATMDGKTTTPGLARIDVVGKACKTAWTNTDVSIPTVVTKMSVANGLIYTYTKPEGTPDAWYFTAIDFSTGKVVYKQLAGTGPLYNNHYAPVYLGPDGTWYVGVLGGLVSLHDGQ